MIEKLDKHLASNINSCNMSQNVMVAHKAIEKINEIVDAVNKLETMAKNTNTVLKSLVEENNIHEKQIDELQMKVEPEKCETRAENVQPDAESRPKNVQDKFAEQRRWIGCLCRFWNFKDGAVDLGILKAIDNLKPIIPYINDIDCSYSFCEPIKPDDSIIYKGE